MVDMAITLDEAATKALVDNMAAYFNLDASDEAQFKEGMRRLLAIQMTMEDILRGAGEITEPLTELATVARTRNPFYVPTLANEGAKP